MNPEHSPFHHESSQYRPEPIEVGFNTGAMADDQQELLTRGITEGTVMLSYDPQTRIGLMQHFHSAAEQSHDVTNFLISARNLCRDPARLVLWAADVEVVHTEEAPLIKLDSTDGTITIDGDPIEL